MSEQQPDQKPITVEYSQLFLEQLTNMPPEVRSEIMDIIDQMEAGEFDFNAARPLGVDIKFAPDDFDPRSKG